MRHLQTSCTESISWIEEEKKIYLPTSSYLFSHLLKLTSWYVTVPVLCRLLLGNSDLTLCAMGLHWNLEMVGGVKLPVDLARFRCCCDHGGGNRSCAFLHLHPQRKPTQPVVLEGELKVMTVAHPLGKWLRVQ